MSWTRLHNEKELQLRIASGDHTAFEELYRSTNRALFAAVIAYTRNSESAQDIVQDVFIKLWEKRKTLTEINNISNFLFIVARNAALDHLKKLASGKKLMTALTDNALNQSHHSRENPTIENLDDRDTRQILRQAINRLSPQQRRAYELAHEQELSHAEIASHMEITSSTVKRHLELARRFVRSYVNDHLTSFILLIILSGLLG